MEQAIQPWKASLAYEFLKPKTNARRYVPLKRLATIKGNTALHQKKKKKTYAAIYLVAMAILQPTA
jgi:hypothetical protein